MNRIALFIVASAFLASQAQARSLGNYKRVMIEETQVQALEITLTQTLETYDGCNHFGTSGDYYELKLPGDEWRLYTPYVADISVTQTEMGCEDLPEPRTVTVTFKKRFEANDRGEVHLDLIVPADFDILRNAIFSPF